MIIILMVRSAYLVEDGDLLIVCDGSRSGLVGRAVKGFVGSTLARIDIDKSVLPEYIYHFIQGKYIQLNKSIKGTGTPHLNQELLMSFELYVPPLEDQHRIVTRIEELFSQLDSGVETLKKTKEQLKVYRQAVLKEAFEGINETVNMSEVADMIDPHPSHRTPPEIQGGIPYIGIGDIDYTANAINYDSARKVSNDILNEHKERYRIQNGDFVMGKIGTIGKPFLLELPQNYALSANVILIQPNSERIKPMFLYWQFTSPLITEQLKIGAKATSQPAFGIKKARVLKIRICSLSRQDQILEYIGEKISVCDSIEKTIDTALQEAEALRQSILKQAFEGGL